MVEIQETDHRCIAADLPGFGLARDTDGFSVDAMAIHVCHLIDELNLQNVYLVGHSMSGKVSMAVAKRSATRVDGLVLVAPSPPSPEPIPDKARKEMLGLSRSHSDGQHYIDNNHEMPLSKSARDRCVADFMRASIDAWSAWLEDGIKDDWADKIGILSLPALVIAAELDKTLGPAVQECLTLPHLTNGRLEIVPQSGHLIPMECPVQLAGMIDRFVFKNQKQPQVPVLCKQRDRMKMNFKTDSRRMIAHGLLAGLLGGVAGSAAKLVGEAIYPPRTQGQEPPPAVLAEKLAGHPLSTGQKTAATQVMHWTLGSGIGAAYGVAAEFYPIVTVGYGVAFGIAVMLGTHDSTLPLLGLNEPPTKQPCKSKQASSPLTRFMGLLPS